MTKDLALSPNHLRIIDANLNRLNEGIRVVEDVFRYAFDNKTIAFALKKLRHEAIIHELYSQMLDARDSQNDVLKPSTSSEMNRDDINTIIIANFKRAQEASRVLEEILKTISTEQAQKFKDIRYTLYTQEKLAFKAIPSQ